MSGDAAKLYANLYPAQRNAISYSLYSGCLGSQARILKRFGLNLRVEQTTLAMAKTIAVPATHDVVHAWVVTARISWLQRGKRSDLPAAAQRALLGRPVYVVQVGRRWRYIDPRVAVLAKPNCGVTPERLGSELLAKVPSWAQKEHFSNNPTAVAGAKLFAVSGCLNCHTYNAAGSENLGAPDLTAEGAKSKGIAFQIAQLKCPSCVNSGSPMPSFAGLGEHNLTKLATFLEASKTSK